MIYTMALSATFLLSGDFCRLDPPILNSDDIRRLGSSLRLLRKSEGATPAGRCASTMMREYVTRSSHVVFGLSSSHCLGG